MARKQKRGSAWAKVGLGILMVGAAGGGALAVTASQHKETISPQTKLEDVDLSGLTREEAAQKLADWFARKSEQKLVLTSDELIENPKDLTPKNLGVSLDVEATLAKAPLDTYWTTLARNVTSPDAKPVELEPVYRFADNEFKDLVVFVEDNAKPNQQARAFYKEGRVELVKEASGVALNAAGMQPAITEALVSGEEVELPLKEAAKKVPDSELEKITGVVAEFSTKFNSGQVARSYNIKRASEIIDGLVLMPGEKFSFNGVVGRRTTAGGFKVAGVYVSGRHDYDVGGGICQVSTTLYNAALFSDLKIGKRSPHSLPVPYVPLGRDAAVSFPNPDLVIENTKSTPIALSAFYQPGRLTFRVLGVPEPEIEVKLEQQTLSSWGNGVKYVHDGTLAYGVEKVVDKGGSGHRATSTRIVLKNGEEIRRESLGTSVYRGGPKIIAMNQKAKPPTEVTAPAEGSAPAAGGSTPMPPTP